MALIDDEISVLPAQYKDQELDGAGYSMLPALQARLSALFHSSTPELMSEQFSSRESLQRRLDALHEARAGCARAAAGSAAGGEDLRFAAEFASAHSRRAMHMRVARNVAHLARSAGQDEVTIDACAFDGVDQATWLCEFSRQPVAELAAGGDVLGIGACIWGRSEALLESPADISVDAFSVTLCSWDAFESAMRYSIRSRGHQAVHGGFQAAAPRRRGWLGGRHRQPGPRGGRGGAATPVGRAREPINAWLPLYVCAAHFRQVEARLPPILGYLVTLDPLGHEEGQELALFTILGHMHAALDVPVGRPPPPPGGGGGQERERMLLREYGRLCHAVQGRAAARLGYDLVEGFLAGSAGPAAGNPMTLVGWAGATAAAARGGGGEAAAERLKQPLLEDEIRCQLSARYSKRKPELWKMINRLLYGSGTAAALVSKAEQERSDSEASYPEGRGDRGAPLRELDPGLWDSEVAAAAASLLADLHLSYLHRAICLPVRELLADRLLLKGVLVNSLMHCTDAPANEAAAAGNMRRAAVDPAAVLRDAHSLLEERRQGVAEDNRAASRNLEAAGRWYPIMDWEMSTGTLCGCLFEEEGPSP